MTGATEIKLLKNMGPQKKFVINYEKIWATKNIIINFWKNWGHIKNNNKVRMDITKTRDEESMVVKIY